MESAHKDGLVNFMVKEVLTVASKLQGSYVGAASTQVTQPQARGKQEIVNEFGLELLQCMEGKSTKEVRIQILILQAYIAYS